MTFTPPVVVNSRIRELKKLGYNSLKEFLDANENHMYVGRNMTHYVPGAEHSKWHNPFKSKNFNDDVEATLRTFEKHIRSSKLYDELHELDGKTIACWCHPAPCHATSLRNMFIEKFCTTSSPTYLTKQENVNRLDLDNLEDFPPLK
jgi:hypothetical protein